MNVNKYVVMEYEHLVNFVTLPHQAEVVTTVSPYLMDGHVMMICALHHVVMASLKRSNNVMI